MQISFNMMKLYIQISLPEYVVVGKLFSSTPKSGVPWVKSHRVIVVPLQYNTSKIESCRTQPLCYSQPVNVYGGRKEHPVCFHKRPQVRRKGDA